MKWEKVEIGKVSKVISGFAFKSKDFQSIGTPIVKIKSIKDENIVLDESDCVDSAIEVPIRFHLSKGDILISLTGSHITLPSSVVGRVARYRHETNSYLNQRAGKFINIDDERCHKDYLFYFLLQKETLTKIANKAQGAANQANISPGDVEGVEINLPPLPTQRKIASILSAYDDLIENNLKRIKLLEEKAFLRYKQIVREEKLEKHILSDFGDIITGKTPSTTIADYFGDDVPFIKTPDMHNQIFIEHTDQMLSELGAKSQEKKFLPPLSLCVSCIGTAGVVGITSKPSQTNQQINSIVFNEPKNVFFFYALMSQMKEQLDALGSNGSTFTNVNKNKFENMEVFVPNQKTLNEFAEEFEAPFKLILTLQKQNTKLREARDILLPKLMNGQIEV